MGFCDSDGWLCLNNGKRVTIIDGLCFTTPFTLPYLTLVGWAQL